MRGLFVAVEGIDGCGKSTFVEGLAKALRRRGMSAMVTAEPTATWLGEAVRRSWAERAGPRIEAYLFMADRVAHCAEIERGLSRGRMVISDRYHDSTLAYQGSALAGSFRGGLRGALTWLRSVSPPGILVPDVTFFLKIDPSEAMDRMSSRSTKSKFERLSVLKGVHSAYLILEREGRFTTLDAAEPPQILVSNAMTTLERAGCGSITAKKMKRGRIPR